MEIKKVDVDDLNLPPAPAKAPQINWGEDFENFDDKRKIIYLKKVCSALNHATDLIQNERNDLITKCKAMAKDVENADKRAEIQKAISLKAITEHNEEKQKLIKRLMELEVEVKTLTTRLKKYEEI